jgi:Uma2 family endonuclease
MSEPLTTMPPLLANGRPVPTELMTYEQFLDWLDDKTHAEWVDGKVVPMSPINGLHDRLVAFLDSLMQLLLEAHPLGKVRGDPFQMKTGPNLPGRAPDLIFIANENLSRLHHTFLEGPADIAVEVISPDSEHRDREDKYREYEQGGVREYWLIDPQNRQADFFRRGEDGRYYPMPLEQGGIFRSQVLPGWWLKVEWLWEPRPKLLHVLREWQLI